MTGRLIALEGLDGSGKTTTWERLKDAFESDTVVFTREPTTTWYGDAVYRSIGDEDADPLAELFLYTADHAAHLANVIEPALDKGQVVITDRYVDSRMVYQGVTLSERFGSIPEGVEFVRQIHEEWTRLPDTTVYLDVSPETGAKRSGETNKMERKERLQRVATAYDLIDEESNRFERVDAEKEMEEVLDDVFNIVEPIIDSVETA